MVHPIRELLRRVIKERGYTLAAVSMQLDPPRHPSWLSKALRGKRRLYLEDIDQILKILGEPQTNFWRRHYGQIAEREPAPPDHPAILLSVVAGTAHQDIPSPIAEVLKAQIPILTREFLRAIPPEVRQVDEMRLSSPPQVALAQGCAVLQERFGRHRARPRNQQMIAELALALGTVASSLRSCGRSRLAARVLSYALERVGETTGVVLADLLWRSGVILVDGGYPAAAIAYLERAQCIFSVSGHTEDEHKTLLTLGVQSLYLNRTEFAACCFRRCLECSEAAGNVRAAALVNLAFLLERQARPEEALTFLGEHHTVIEGANHRWRTNARWIEARALEQTGHLQEAALCFKALSPHIAAYCEPVDPLLFFLDYAIVLIRLGDLRDLTAAHRVVKARNIELLPGTATLLEEAVPKILQGHLSASDVRLLRQELVQAAARD